jgi:hypothetical protein
VPSCSGCPDCCSDCTPAWGVTGPFWFGFVGSAVILALIWRQLVHIAHACDELDEAVPAR